MKEELEAIGLSDKYVAQKYKDFLEDEEMSETTRLNALNRISRLRGHDDKEIEQSQESVVLLTDGDRKLLAESRRQISSQSMDDVVGEINVKVIEDFQEEIVEEADYDETEEE
jgi:hypothetical protein